MSQMMLFFSFCRPVRFAAQNRFICWSNGKVRKGIHKPVQCYKVMEIRRKLHHQVVGTHVPTEALEVKEKEELKKS